MLNNDYLKKKATAIRYFFSDVDGTLTDGNTYYSPSGELLKSFSHVDGTGFLLLRKAGIIPGFITGENNEIIVRRAEKLKLEYCFLGVEDKLALMNDFCLQHQTTLSAIAYIGDDLNDLALIKAVGLSFAVGNARAVVKEAVDIVCNEVGGKGGFREAVENLLLLQDKDPVAVFNSKLPGV